MRLERSEKYGLGGTLIAAILLLLVLFLVSFSRPQPSEESGMEMNFGTINEATGMFEPSGYIPPQIEQAEPIIEPVEDPIVSQEIEETVHINPPKKEKEKSKPKLQPQVDNKRERELEARKEKDRLEQAQKEKQAQSIQAQLAGAFGKGSNTGSQGASDLGVGNQGNPNGNAGLGNGSGGSGNYDLGGRGLGNGGLKIPTAITNETGRIIIDIIVSPSGKVISATIRPSSNIENRQQRERALTAARSTQFAAINGAQNQSGTITYHFTLK